jgi:hypothetical protein
VPRRGVGSAQDLRERAGLHDPTLLQHDEIIRERERIDGIVRDDHRGAGQGGQPHAEVAADRGAHQRIERGERLIEQQDARFARERPGDRDTLTFAARERGDPTIGEGLECELLQEVGHAGATGLVRPGAEAITHIPGDIEMREQRERLRHMTDRTVFRRHPDAGGVIEPDVVVQRRETLDSVVRAPPAPAAGWTYRNHWLRRARRHDRARRRMTPRA